MELHGPSWTCSHVVYYGIYHEVTNYGVDARSRFLYLVRKATSTRNVQNWPMNTGTCNKNLVRVIIILDLNINSGEWHLLDTLS